MPVSERHPPQLGILITSTASSTVSTFYLAESDLEFELNSEGALSCLKNLSCLVYNVAIREHSLDDLRRMIKKEDRPCTQVFMGGQTLKLSLTPDRGKSHYQLHGALNAYGILYSLANTSDIRLLQTIDECSHSMGAMLFRMCPYG